MGRSSPSGSTARARRRRPSSSPPRRSPASPAGRSDGSGAGSAASPICKVEGSTLLGSSVGSLHGSPKRDGLRVRFAGEAVLVASRLPDGSWAGVLDLGRFGRVEIFAGDVRLLFAGARAYIIAAASGVLEKADSFVPWPPRSGRR